DHGRGESKLIMMVTVVTIPMISNMVAMMTIQAIRFLVSGIASVFIEGFCEAGTVASTFAKACSLEAAGVESVGSGDATVGAGVSLLGYTGRTVGRNVSASPSATYDC